jgi:hypothetical protein
VPFVAVAERLVGTPARAAVFVADVPEKVLMRPAGGWSIKEHFGLPPDLHTIDLHRVRAFLAVRDHTQLQSRFRWTKWRGRTSRAA